jgi:hypothetical protein
MHRPDPITICKCNLHSTDHTARTRGSYRHRESLVLIQRFVVLRFYYFRVMKNSAKCPLKSMSGKSQLYVCVQPCSSYGVSSQVITEYFLSLLSGKKKCFSKDPVRFKPLGYKPKVSRCRHVCNRLLANKITYKIFRHT